MHRDRTLAGRLGQPHVQWRAFEPQIALDRDTGLVGDVVIGRASAGVADRGCANQRLERGQARKRAAPDLEVNKHGCRALGRAALRAVELGLLHARRQDFKVHPRRRARRPAVEQARLGVERGELVAQQLHRAPGLARCAKPEQRDRFIDGGVAEPGQVATICERAAAALEQVGRCRRWRPFRARAERRGRRKERRAARDGRAGAVDQMHDQVSRRAD